MDSVKASPSPVNEHEFPVVFICEGQRLLGIATKPAHHENVGILIIVGGPQYRAGSHRQFTLLARRLANEGVASFRFDYRGMGDSEGEPRNFEYINEDIRAAIDQFQNLCPWVSRIILWGLCDAASAAMLYAQHDNRVIAQILLNPWVHTEEGAAKVRLKSYYLSRFFQTSFWKKLLMGEIKPFKSITELIRTAKTAKSISTHAQHKTKHTIYSNSTYIDRMLSGIKSYKGHTLVILSSDDYVAQEFTALTTSNRTWAKALKSERISIVKVENANHTFSSFDLRERVETLTLNFTKDLGSR